MSEIKFLDKGEKKIFKGKIITSDTLKSVYNALLLLGEVNCGNSDFKVCSAENLKSLTVLNSKDLDMVVFYRNNFKESLHFRVNFKPSLISIENRTAGNSDLHIKFIEINDIFDHCQYNFRSILSFTEKFYYIFFAPIVILLIDVLLFFIIDYKKTDLYSRFILNSLFIILPIIIHNIIKPRSICSINSLRKYTILGLISIIAISCFEIVKGVISNIIFQHYFSK